jgi:non-homologous end joining protein Ku
MKSPKYHLHLTEKEHHLLIQALIDLKNKLLNDGRYTDAVDEVIINVLKNKKKKFRTS